jgi:hypothetical protein
LGGHGGGGSGGSFPSPRTGSDGVVNTGGGGGAGTGGGDYDGGSGGSGVVILKYPDTKTLSNPGGGLTFTTDDSTVSGYKITTFTAGTGNIQFS